MFRQGRTNANRQNAQRSTGPKTPDGRRASSLNALKHGFSSKEITIPGEDHNHFLTLYQALDEDLNPKSALEVLAVEHLAASTWRLRRVNYLEALMLRAGFRRDPDAHPPVKTLVYWVDEGEKPDPEFLKPLPPPPPPDPADLGSNLMKGQIRSLSLLARHESVLLRRYQRSFDFLLNRQDPDSAENYQTNPCPKMEQPSATDSKENENLGPDGPSLKVA